MSELLKAAQPTLKVSDDSEPAAEPAGAEPSVSVAPQQIISGRTDETRLDCPAASLEPAVSGPLQSPVDGVKAKARLGSNGMTRHRLIVACCIAVSSVVLAVSVLDLKSAIRRVVKIDPSMKITEQEPGPTLGSNLQYLETADFSSGLTPVSESTWQGTRVGYVNKAGAMVIAPKYRYGYAFRDGLAAVALVDPSDDPRDDRGPSARNKKWIYINKLGKPAFAGEFSEAGEFNNGVAAVTLQSDMGGLINSSGEKISPRMYSMPQYLRNGKAYVAEGLPHRFGLLSPGAKWLLPPAFNEIAVLPLARKSNSWSERHLRLDPPSTASNYKPDEYLAIRKGSLWGVADLHGKVLLPPLFEKIVDFNKGWASVKVDGQYGFVSTKGDTIAEQFDFATPYDDIIAVKKDEKWRFMDSSGKMLSVPGADGIIVDSQTRRWFNNGLGAVIKNNKVGFVDGKGKLVIPARFEFAQAFSNGYSAVLDKGFWYYIDTSGRVRPQKFSDVAPLDRVSTTVSIPGPLYELSEANDIHWDANAVQEKLKFWSLPNYNPDREYERQ